VIRIRTNDSSGGQPVETTRDDDLAKEPKWRL
jgi:hypothetical protein